MAKRLTSKEKLEIIQSFSGGKNIDFLSKKFSCTNLTIIRNLKKELGEKKYQQLNKRIKIKKEKNIFERNKNLETININLNNEFSNKDLSEIKRLNKIKNECDFSPEASFLEISPLVDYEIEESSRKELSSVRISDINLPKIVYMIVDKKIELKIKLLKDYPEWGFLPLDDLNRKTIEIYLDLKIAKRFCNHDQKVIKVPNTDVFKIVAPILISRGISRIVSSDILIAL